MEELIKTIEFGDRENYTVSEDYYAGVCRVCGGTGWEPVIESVAIKGCVEKVNAVQRCRACNGNYRKRISDASARAGIPVGRSLKDFDWSVYDTDVLREKSIVDKFIDSFPEFERENLGLYITSKTRGSGKTFLASAVGGELIKRYEASVRFVNASELLDLSQEKHRDMQDPLESLTACRVLIIDDLGQKLTGRDWLTDVLFRIIDKRYRFGKITILTSNVPLRDLDFDDRIADRLNAMTITVRIPEVCVRARQANARKTEILKRLGVME